MARSHLPCILFVTCIYPVQHNRSFKNRKKNRRTEENKEERREKRAERETSYFRAEIKNVILFYGLKASLARPADRNSIK